MTKDSTNKPALETKPSDPSGLRDCFGISSCFLFRWLGRLFLWLALCLIYLSLPSQQYDLDTLSELSRINNLDPTSPDPAHMFYAILGIPFYGLWLRLGYTGDALRAMQVLNAVFGAVAVVVLTIILRQIKVHRHIAVSISVAAGFSYAFWTHTEDAFFIIPAACFSLVALLCALILAEAQSSARRRVILLALGLNLSLASLSYQANLFLIPALMAASWAGTTRWRRWVCEWLFIGAVVAVLAGGGWLYQAIHFAEVRTLPEFFSWFIRGHGGIARGLWRREDVPWLSTTAAAWVATILPLYEGMRLRDLLHGKFSLWHLPSQIALLLLVITGFLALNVLRHIYQKHRPIMPARIWLTCGLWFAIPGSAVFWFDRAEVKLWLIPFFACWIGLAGIVNAGHSISAGRLSRLLIMSLVSTLPCAIGISNFMLAIWPNYAYESIDIRRAQFVASQMHPDDLLITAGFDWVNYVPYFCSQCRVVNVVAIAQMIPKEREREIKQALWEHMEMTWMNGGRVYAVEYLGIPTDPAWVAWITPYTGLVPQDFVNLDKQYAWQVEGEVIWELKAGPVPQDCSSER